MTAVVFKVQKLAYKSIERRWLEYNVVELTVIMVIVLRNRPRVEGNKMSDRIIFFATIVDKGERLSQRASPTETGTT